MSNVLPSLSVNEPAILPMRRQGPGITGIGVQFAIRDANAGICIHPRTDVASRP